MALLSNFGKSLKEIVAKLLLECFTVIISQIHEITSWSLRCFRSHINYCHPEALYLSNVLLNPLRIIGPIIIRNIKYVKQYYTLRHLPKMWDKKELIIFKILFFKKSVIYSFFFVINKCNIFLKNTTITYMINDDYMMFI